MKIGGLKIEGDLAKPNEDVLVLERPNNKQIIFTARAFQTLEDFETLCPSPTAPQIFQAGKGWIPQLSNETYLQQVEEYGTRHVGYIVIKSLEPSEIEWDLVKIDDPSTWGKWEEDLLNNNFSQRECNLVLKLCWDINNLDEGKIERARELFLRGQEEVSEKSASPATEPKNSRSGKPASVAK